MSKDVHEDWSGKNDLNQIDVVSRIEQEICVHANSFLGTSVSSWTHTVYKARAELRGVQSSPDVHARNPLPGDDYLDTHVLNQFFQE